MPPHLLTVALGLALHLGLKAHDVLDCTHYCYAPHLVAPTYARVVDALLQPP